jgi:hypothetical protein
MSQVEDGKCIWYGECHRDEKGKVKNCYKVIEAPELKELTALEILGRRCPHLNVDNGEFQRVLCGFLYSYCAKLSIYTDSDSIVFGR